MSKPLRSFVLLLSPILISLLETGCRPFLIILLYIYPSAPLGHLPYTRGGAIWGSYSLCPAGTSPMSEEELLGVYTPPPHWGTSPMSGEELFGVLYSFVSTWGFTPPPRWDTSPMSGEELLGFYTPPPHWDTSPMSGEELFLSSLLWEL